MANSFLRVSSDNLERIKGCLAGLRDRVPSSLHEELLEGASLIRTDEDAQAFVAMLRMVAGKNLLPDPSVVAVQNRKARRARARTRMIPEVGNS